MTECGRDERSFQGPYWISERAPRPREDIYYAFTINTNVIDMSVRTVSILFIEVFLGVSLGAHDHSIIPTSINRKIENPRVGKPWDCYYPPHR